MGAPKHPATFSEDLLVVCADALDRQLPRRRETVWVLDPFAGVGTIHDLPKLTRTPLITVGVEIMPNWANARPGTMRGDATRLRKGWTGKFGAVVTSPCYGNRMSDHHDAQDPSVRHSYKHDYGDGFEVVPAARNAGVMGWSKGPAGDAYRELHVKAWREVHRVLAPRGLFLLNVKDHIRQHERQWVSAWHRRTVESIGFERLETVSVPLRGMAFGANREARVPNEYIYVFRKIGRA